MSSTAFLPHLPPHLPTLGGSFVFFLAIHQLAPLCLERALPPSVHWDSLSRRARNNFAIHLVSQVHALIIVPLALSCLRIPALDRDRAYGWDERSGTLQAVACGYFLWDTLDAVVNYIDLGFVVHGLACLVIYLFSFKPFVAYYASRCLLWETSTLFLNVHWFLDKTNRTGSTLQLINGVLLLSSFFGVRLVYGGLTSYDFFRTVLTPEVRGRDGTLAAVYGVGNVVLQGLNWVWFGKMIAALRRRFASDKKATNGLASGHANEKAKSP